LQTADLNRIKWTDSGDLDLHSRVIIGCPKVPEDTPAIVIDTLELAGPDATTTDEIKAGKSCRQRKQNAAKNGILRFEREHGIDLSNRVTMNSGGYRNSVYRHIPVTQSLARLLGLYVAEGGCHHQRVTFTFSLGECDTLAAEVVSLVRGVFGVE